MICTVLALWSLSHGLRPSLSHAVSVQQGPRQGCCARDGNKAIRLSMNGKQNNSSVCLPPSPGPRRQLSDRMPKKWAFGALIWESDK